MTKPLIRNGANPHAEAPEGWLPLHYASAKGYVSAVKLLLQTGATSQARRSGGWMALYDAAGWGRQRPLLASI